MFWLLFEVWLVTLIIYWIQESNSCFWMTAYDNDVLRKLLIFLILIISDSWLATISVYTDYICCSNLIPSSWATYFSLHLSLKILSFWNTSW